MSGCRPHHATGAPDKNHYMISEFMRDVCGGYEDKKFGSSVLHTASLRGYRVWAIDTHGPGGVLLDWIIGCAETGISLLIEVKTPEAYRAKNNSIRPGEQATLSAAGVCARLVVTDDDVSKAFLSLVGA